jgi:hypothetical protein
MINGILGLIYTSNFVGDFLLLTNANEWNHSQKYEIAFRIYNFLVFCMPLVQSHPRGEKLPTKLLVWTGI